MGSGKTSLINSALKDPALENSFIVINEFGEVGLDHALVTSSDDSIVILENGCLCCTVFGDLIGTLNNIYHQREAGDIPYFERIIIETSGLADPTSLVQAFLSDPTLEGLYRLAKIVTVVDAVNFAETISDHDEAVRQVALADTIILSKRSLVRDSDDSDSEAGLLDLIKRMNSTAQIIEYEAIDHANLFKSLGVSLAEDRDGTRAWIGYDERRNEASASANKHDHGHHHASHAHISVTSFCYEKTEPMPMRALQLLLDGIERNLGKNLLRLKAVVTVTEEVAGPAVIHGVQHLLHNTIWLDYWPFDDRKSRFVLIVANIEASEIQDMLELVDRVAMRSAKAQLEAH